MSAPINALMQVTDATQGVIARVDGSNRKNPIYVRTFSSVTDFIRHVDRAPISGAGAIIFKNAEDHSQSGTSWYGIKGGAEAVRAAVNTGWSAGRTKLETAFNKVIDVPVPVSLRRRPVRGEYGDELDVHAVNRGDLSHAWTRRARRTTIGRRVIRLVAQVLDNAGHGADQLFWRGAAVLKLATVLVESGYSVEIFAGWAVTLSTDPRWTSADLVRVKAEADPLNVQSIASALCLSGFGRYYGFKALAHAGEETTGTAPDSGIGHAADLDAILSDVTDRYVTGRINTAYDAQQWIKETISDIQGAIK